MDDLPYFTNIEGWPSPQQPFDLSTNSNPSGTHIKLPINTTQNYHDADGLAGRLENTQEPTQDTCDDRIPCRISNTEWEAVKDVIHNYYIISNRTLDETRSLVWSKYNFWASEPQYNRRLKSWGFKKYQENADWLGVSHALKRRRTDIDSADIILNGVHISPKRLRKEISRRDRPALKAKFAEYLNEPAPRSPQSPSGLIIRQQNSYSIIVSPPRSLPWFDFLDRFTNVFEHLTKFPGSDNTHGLHLLKSDDRRGLINHIFGVKDHVLRAYRQDASFRALTKETQHWLPIMVERTTGDLEDAMGDMITSRDHPKVLILATAYLVYMCANSLNYLSGILTWIDVVQQYQLSSFLNCIIDIRSPSTEIFLNRLFSAAISLQNMWLLRQVAKKGLHIDTRLMSSLHGSLSGLHFVLREHGFKENSVEMAKLLISLGSDPNQCCCTVYHAYREENCIRPMDLAANNGNLIGLVEYLLGLEAECNRATILTSVIQHGGQVELIRRLINCGASLNNVVLRYSDDHSELRSPLLAAVQVHSIEVVEMLIYEGYCGLNLSKDLDCTRLIVDGETTANFGFPLACSIALGGTIQRQMSEILLDSGANVNDCYCNYMKSLPPFLKLDCLSEILTCCGFNSDSIRTLGNPLQVAAACNDFDMVEKLIERRADLEPCHGPPAIALSVANSNHQITQLLLVHGASPNSSVTQNSGLTSLVLAVAKGDIEMVKLLLMHDASISPEIIKDTCYLNLVHLYIAQNIEDLQPSIPSLSLYDWKAIESRCRLEFGTQSLNDAEMVPYTAKQLRSQYSSPLQRLFEYWLLCVSEISILRTCLNAGACISALSEGNASAMSRILQEWPESEGYCLKHPPKSILAKCELLIEHGARVGLMEFCLVLSPRRPKELAQLVLSHPDCLTSPLQKNLCYLAEDFNSDHIDVWCSLLPQIFKTARLDASDEVGSSLLRITLFATWLCVFWDVFEVADVRGMKAVEVATALFEGTNDVNTLIPTSELPRWSVPIIYGIMNQISNICIAPIHILLGSAAVGKLFTPPTLRLEILRAFVDMGADVNIACTKNGESMWTPLHLICAMRDSLREAEYLIQAGADVNATFTASTTRYHNDARSAIQMAITKENLQVVELLIAKGADVNLPGGDEENGGGTALQLAVAEGYFRIMQVLVEAGAELDVDREDGRTIFDIAAENGRLDCLKYLLDKWKGRMSISEVCKKAAVLAQRENHLVIAKYLREYRC